jgi:hypothetical protein
MTSNKENSKLTTLSLKRKIDSIISNINNNNSIDQNPFKPKDEQFIKRLESFKSSNWYLKPECLNSLECALHGWWNVSENKLECHECKARLLITINLNDKDAVNSDLIEKYLKQLKLSHKKSCKMHWQSCNESIYRFPTLPSIRAFNFFKNRINSLLRIHEFLPKIKKPMVTFDDKKLEMLICILDLPKTYTKEIIEIAIYLSIFGWQGYAIRGKGYIQCLFCRRLVGLWNFTNHYHPDKIPNKIAGTINNKRSLHNINLKRLNEIIAKRKAKENIGNLKKKLKTKNDNNSNEKEKINSINKTITNNNDEVPSTSTSLIVNPSVEMTSLTDYTNSELQDMTESSSFQEQNELNSSRKDDDSTFISSENNDEIGDITRMEEIINTQRKDINEIIKKHEVILHTSLSNILEENSISFSTDNNDVESNVVENNDVKKELNDKTNKERDVNNNNEKSLNETIETPALLTVSNSLDMDDGISTNHPLDSESNVVFSNSSIKEEEGESNLDSTLNDSIVNEGNINDSSINESNVKDNIVNDSSINESNVKDNIVNDSSINESNVNDNIVNDSSTNESNINESNVIKNNVNDSNISESNAKESNISESNINKSNVNNSNKNDTGIAQHNEEEKNDNNDLKKTENQNKLEGENNQEKVKSKEEKIETEHEEAVVTKLNETKKKEKEDITYYYLNMEKQHKSYCPWIYKKKKECSHEQAGWQITMKAIIAQLDPKTIFPEDKKVFTMKDTHDLLKHIKSVLSSSGRKPISNKKQKL